ncbi:MAG: hypothetical protein RLZZ93_1558, partial [Actinomycetota bacterium]
MADAMTDDLLAWLDACPTPFHAARRAADELVASGFSPVQELANGVTARGVMVRDGSVVAWVRSPGAKSFRVLGAHTDSPNLRIQPN